MYRRRQVRWALELCLLRFLLHGRLLLPSCAPPVWRGSGTRGSDGFFDDVRRLRRLMVGRQRVTEAAPPVEEA